MAATIADRLRSDLTAAMKAHDASAVSVLRTALAAIANAQAVDATGSGPSTGLFANEVPRRKLTPEEIRNVVAGQRDELRAAATELHRLGHAEHSAELTEQVALLDSYLANQP